MLLATRALGLGATLTSRHMIFGQEVDAALGLPDDIKSFAILPIGYPEGNFGPVGRGPLEEIVYKDQWGAAYFG
jgi:nitroreductase